MTIHKFNVWRHKPEHEQGYGLNLNTIYDLKKSALLMDDAVKHV
jgi:hypothetical protein